MGIIAGSGVNEEDRQPPLYLPQSWGRGSTYTLLFSSSFEDVFDVKMRARFKSPSPKLGRVRVGLTPKNSFPASVTRLF